MKEQFAIVTNKDSENLEFLEVDGKKVFESIEEAESAAVRSGLENLTFFKREVSPWTFIGDMVASSTGKF